MPSPRSSTTSSVHEDEKPKREKPDDETDKQSSLARLEMAEAAVNERPLPPRWRTGKPVLCIPGPSLLDEAAAAIVAQLLERQGIGARAEQAGALSMSRLFDWKTHDVALICLCYVEHATPAQIRYAVRRIRRRAPDVLILVALFGNTGPSDGDEGLERIDSIQQSLAETVDRIMTIASKPLDDQVSTESPGIAPAA